MLKLNPPAWIWIWPVVTAQFYLKAKFRSFPSTCTLQFIPLAFPSTHFCQTKGGGAFPWVCWLCLKRNRAGFLRKAIKSCSKEQSFQSLVVPGRWRACSELQCLFTAGQGLSLLVAFSSSPASPQAAAKLYSSGLCTGAQWLAGFQVSWDTKGTIEAKLGEEKAQERCLCVSTACQPWQECTQNHLVFLRDTGMGKPAIPSMHELSALCHFLYFSG